jgi:DNA-binding Lrp family transcriptional regulator
VKVRQQEGKGDEGDSQEPAPAAGRAEEAVTQATPPKDLQPLDAVDRALVAALVRDARTTNAALAEQVGIAASTCHGRVRSLVERGVLRGFSADVDLEALGYGVRAVIAVRLQPGARSRIGSFATRLADLPGVQHLYFLAGADDFLVDVVAADTAGLRSFVVGHLSEDPDVAATETNLVFEFVRGSSGP